MGVWIETCPSRYTQTASEVTPFVGVWIETIVIFDFCVGSKVTPFVGVWIETKGTETAQNNTVSHPSWVCGLKLISSYHRIGITESHPSWVCGLKH